jgi:hypothetical protein
MLTAANCDLGSDTYLEENAHDIAFTLPRQEVWVTQRCHEISNHDESNKAFAVGDRWHASPRASRSHQSAPSLIPMRAKKQQVRAQNRATESNATRPRIPELGEAGSSTFGQSLNRTDRVRETERATTRTLSPNPRYDHRLRNTNGGRGVLKDTSANFERESSKSSFSSDSCWQGGTYAANLLSQVHP